MIKVLFNCNKRGDKMDKQNSKCFNAYVFLSTFARKMIEVYIPLMLFKFGYTLDETILYYMLVMVISLIITFPILYLSNYLGNKKLSFIGVVSFIIVQVMLAKMVYSAAYIFGLALLYSIYRRAYWCARNYYMMVIIHEKNTSKEYSILSVINQFSLMLSGYAGGWLLTVLDNKYVMLISFTLFIFSTFFLAKLKIDEYPSEKTSIKKAFRECPKRNIHIIGTYEILAITKFLFTLYVFINIKETYLAVGILELVSSLATMLFTYLYGKKINGEKNYLKLSILLVTLIYIAKVNITMAIPFGIICFLEGLVTKMQEVSIYKGCIKFSKKVGEYNANIIREFSQNLYRALIMVLVMFTNNLKVMIYIAIVMMFTGIFFNFKEEKIEE